MTDIARPFVRICWQLKDDAPCGNTTNTQWFEGFGWRCRFHIPEGQGWPHSRRGVQDEHAGGHEPDPEPTAPPVDALVTLADAISLSSWAAIEIAFGRLSENRGRGVITACRQFQSLLNNKEGRGKLDEIEALMLGTMKKLGLKSGS